jgi:hypothetical protein
MKEVAVTTDHLRESQILKSLFLVINDFIFSHLWKKEGGRWRHDLKHDDTLRNDTLYYDSLTAKNASNVIILRVNYSKWFYIVILTVVILNIIIVSIV